MSPEFDAKVNEMVAEIARRRREWPRGLFLAVESLSDANTQLFYARRMASSREHRYEVTGFNGSIQKAIVNQQHRCARRAAANAAKALALLGLAQPRRAA